MNLPSWAPQAGRFDQCGELWLEVQIQNIPNHVIQSGHITAKPVGVGSAGTVLAITEMNLTQYVRWLVDQMVALP